MSEAGRAERCPKCESPNRAERLIIGTPLDHCACFDGWHDAPTVASTVTPASGPGSAEQKWSVDTLKRLCRKLRAEKVELFNQLQEREREKEYMEHELADTRAELQGALTLEKAYVSANNERVAVLAKLAEREATIQRLREALEKIRECSRASDARGIAFKALAHSDSTGMRS